MTDMSIHSQPLLFTQAQQQELDNCLMRLADRIAAPLVMVTDISGRLILYRGRLSAAKSTALAALAAGSFGAGVEMGNFLGLRDENAFHQQLHEGKAANLFTVAIEDELLLVIVYTQRTTLGLVRVYSQTAQEEILELVQTAKEARAKAVLAADEMDRGGFGSAITDQLDELFPD